MIKGRRYHRICSLRWELRGMHKFVRPTCLRNGRYHVSRVVEGFVGMQFGIARAKRDTFANFRQFDRGLPTGLLLRLLDLFCLCFLATGDNEKNQNGSD